MKRDSTLVRSQVTLKSLIKSLKLEKQGFLVELNMLQEKWVEEPKLWEKVPIAIRLELTNHASIFQPLPGLPPIRDINHGIKLFLGMAPISARLHRYPQFQKDEIEKLVEEMLVVDIIQPSNSAFSSLVLLMEKKDGR